MNEILKYKINFTLKVLTLNISNDYQTSYRWNREKRRLENT